MKLLLPLLLISPLCLAKSKFVVLIDPGHGGEDQGTSHFGVLEKDLTLSVSHYLSELLEKDRQFEVHMTRTKDLFVDIDKRIKKAENLNVDVMVSIHANSSTIASAHGTEIYFESQVPTDEEALLTANRENNVKKQEAEESANTHTDIKSILGDMKRSNHMVTSQLLSEALLESMQNVLKTKNKSIRQGPFRVLTVSSPAVLIEMGFISNPKEAQWLKSIETQKKIAQAIYKGLVDFRKKLDKQKK
ncbi:MAG: N-acetylmuramoyl-L-alanine amidase [Oligoflexia bacterium]|nr:N-acetylmuramoyl-L-alanine amidase [Oligoflexia bacterium]